MTNIAVINIGSELLRGLIVNTNISDIAKQLWERGYTIAEQHSIHDSPDQIITSLNELLNRHDVLIITGGLGPTTDDLTKSTLAAYFNTTLQLHEPTLAHIQALFAKFGREVNPSNEQQAILPVDCEILHNQYGTAMGMLFKHENKLVFALPGVPFEMRHLVNDAVIPKIEQCHPNSRLEKRVLRNFGISESAAAEKMKLVAPQLSKAISIAYLPSFQGLKIELHASIDDPMLRTQTLEELDNAKIQVKNAFRNYCYADVDLSLEELLHKNFVQKGLTVATAESMTSGKLAAALTSQSGSSVYFTGSIIAYHTDIKLNQLNVVSSVVKEQGVVNELVAKQMAEGIRQIFGTDIGISTTGNAEENSSEHDSRPGVWVGISSADGTSAHYFPLVHDRTTNIERATAFALFQCLKNVFDPFEP